MYLHTLGEATPAAGNSNSRSYYGVSTSRTSHMSQVYSNIYSICLNFVLKLSVYMRIANIAKILE